MNKRIEKKRKLNARQKKFVAEYIKSGGNAAQAYRNAGYKEKYAERGAYQLKQKPEIKEYIEGITEAQEKAGVADAQEIMQYLTDVLRGKHESAEFAIIGIGKGRTDVKQIMRPPTEREMLKAAETLCRAKGLFKNEGPVNAGVLVQIVDDIPDLDSETEEGGGNV